ncbi:hypothetical protein L7F22_051095, partial [Adiantum nelumboides]|nr:hypothetical protein [Adiantum nelumboides]
MVNAEYRSSIKDYGAVFQGDLDHFDYFHEETLYNGLQEEYIPAPQLPPLPYDYKFGIEEDIREAKVDDSQAHISLVPLQMKKDDPMEEALISTLQVSPTSQFVQ